MHAGGFTYADGEDDISKEKYLRIYLKNVGEDLILNLEILLWKINGEKVEASCSNKVVYKNEEIIFELDIAKYWEIKDLEIDIIFQMENVAGVKYIQTVNIGVRKLYDIGVEKALLSQSDGINLTNLRNIYVVEKYGSSIRFVEKNQ